MTDTNYVCPHCGATSPHLRDPRSNYCPNCHHFCVDLTAESPLTRIRQSPTQPTQEGKEK